MAAHSEKTKSKMNRSINQHATIVTRWIASLQGVSFSTSACTLSCAFGSSNPLSPSHHHVARKQGDKILQFSSKGSKKVPFSHVYILSRPLDSQCRRARSTKSSLVWKEESNLSNDLTRSTGATQLTGSIVGIERPWLVLAMSPPCF
jgi:hypothetical protein